jgi:hypothetical protein
MNATIWDFLPSAGVISAAVVGVALIAPLSSVGMRPRVAGIVTGDHVYDLLGLRLFSLMWLRSVAITRPLLVHLFDSSALTHV